MKANFASQVKKGKLTEEKMGALMKKLHGTLTYDNFKSVDMVRPLSNPGISSLPCTILNLAFCGNKTRIISFRQGKGSGPPVREC